MALTAIDLTGDMCVRNGCTELIFNDATGFLVTPCNDEYNEFGYGLIGGISVNDVTTASLIINFPNIDTSIGFVFNINNGVITSAIMTDVNLNNTDITSLLESTVFPFNNFNITKDYGVIIPAITDGIYNWDYTITGVSGIENFLYTTSGGFLSDCKAKCCVMNSYLDIDFSCSCSSDKIKSLIKTELLISASNFSIDAGEDSKADDFISKANEICENKCKNC